MHRPFAFHLRVSSVLGAVLLILVGTPGAAQDTAGVGAISGVVVNAAGQPTEGVRVCVLDIFSCATSDARGVFRIGELRAGGYRVEILPLEGLRFIAAAPDDDVVGEVVGADDNARQAGTPGGGTPTRRV
jgi:Carboxypeptidase regulatory-like domain